MGPIVGALADTTDEFQPDYGSGPVIEGSQRDYRGSGVPSGNIELVLQELGVTVSPKQREILHCQRRKMLVAGGERAGKSFTSALYAIVRIPYGKLFWFVGPDYEQAQAEFKYTIEMLGQLGAIRSQRDVSMPKVGKWQAVLRSGQLLETKSADEVKKIASKAPDGIIMCEAAQHQYASYLRCVGRVAEKRGWLFMCGTFEGSEGWYPELFDEWALANNPDGGVSYSLASWENPFVYPLGRQDPEIQSLEIAYRRVPGMFEERCGAIPVPPIGLVPCFGRAELGP